MSVGIVSQRKIPPTSSKLPGLEMIAVEPGEFLIGDPANHDAGTRTDDRQHQVTLTKPFSIGKYPVTVAQFSEFAAQTGFKTWAEKKGFAFVHADKPQQFRAQTRLNWRTAFSDVPDTVPVVSICWYDANAYCEWVQNATGVRTRLPTEAEWEYACRAGTGSKFNTVGTPDSLGWFGCNSGDHMFDSPMLGQRTYITYKEKVMAEHCQPHPVGEKLPNQWGLYDMHGNVWEWCSDVVAPYTDQPTIDPVGPDDPTAKFRIARGGNWFDPPSTAASYNRGWWVAAQAYYHVGFRVVQEA